MTKDKKTNQGLGISPENAELLLREAAIREGVCPPETIEELEIVEERLAGQRFEPPAFGELMKRIRENSSTPADVIRIENHVDQNVVADLSMAARNGKEIPKETRDRMDADRSKAEGGNGSRA